MSADTEHSPPVRPQRKFISKAIAELYRLIDDVNHEIHNQGNPSVHTKRQLRSQLATVTVILRTHRDDMRMEWDDQTPFEGGPEEIISGMFGDEQSESAQKYSLQDLYMAATDMLEVASSLGLTAPVEQKTNETHPEPI